MLNLEIANATGEKLIDVLQHPFRSNPDDFALIVHNKLTQEVVSFFLDKSHGVPPALFPSQLLLSGRALLGGCIGVCFSAPGKELYGRLVLSGKIVHQLDRANRVAQEIVDRRKNVFAIQPENIPEFRFRSVNRKDLAGHRWVSQIGRAGLQEKKFLVRHIEQGSLNFKWLRFDARELPESILRLNPDQPLFNKHRL